MHVDLDAVQIMTLAGALLGLFVCAQFVWDFFHPLPPKGSLQRRLPRLAKGITAGYIGILYLSLVTGRLVWTVENAQAYIRPAIVVLLALLAACRASDRQEIAIWMVRPRDGEDGP